MSDQTPGLVYILRRTRPWVRLASVIGFVLSGVMAFLAIDTVVGLTGPQRRDPLPALLIYVVSFAALLIPSVQLQQFSSRIVTFVAQGHRVQLEAALEAQRRFWRVAGVLMVAGAVLLVFGLVLLVVR